MNLTDIRHRLGDTLDTIAGVRVHRSVPEALAASGVTAVVIAAGEPYVTFAEGAGRTSTHEVRLRLVVIPVQQAGAERVQAELDDLLGCGPRSIRDTVAADLSLGGTVCSASVTQAAVRTMTANDLSHVVAELDIKILARC